jgi:hypothetical protein
VSCGVLAVSIMVLLVTAHGQLGGSHEFMAAALLLVNFARMGQALARARRIGGMIKNLEAQDRGVNQWVPQQRFAPRPRIPEAGNAPARFFQQFCSVSRVTAGGNLGLNAQQASFTVAVTNGHLEVTDAGIPFLSVPVPQVRIVTPRLQRKLGGGSVVRVDGRLWCIQFDRVYLAELSQSGRRGAATRAALLGLGAPRKSMRRAREINQHFTTALLQAGAIDGRR